MVVTTSTSRLSHRHPHIIHRRRSPGPVISLKHLHRQPQLFPNISFFLWWHDETRFCVQYQPAIDCVLLIQASEEFSSLSSPSLMSCFLCSIFLSSPLDILFQQLIPNQKVTLGSLGCNYLCNHSPGNNHALSAIRVDLSFC